jgi:SAM-dependent methyltransferase
MNTSLAETLRCPVTGSALALEITRSIGSRVESGLLWSADRLHCYPIVNFVPRFVPSANYAETFGLQWNHFRATQLDSHSGHSISADRFWRFSGWNSPDLAGKRVLDVGCGAGRFAEIALQAGAHVVAIDYSSAVDACWANHRMHPRLDVVQADVYRLPFMGGQFDFVYCFGVLQHTPDVRGAFMALPPQLREGGKLAVDVYPALLRNIFWAKYWLRPITSRLPASRLYSLVERFVPSLLSISRALRRVPFIGRRLGYAIPVVNYEGVYPLTPAQLQEWAVLDTFDMLAPRHDHPQTASRLRSWLEEAGMDDVFVERMGFHVGRGTRRRTAKQF